MAHRGNFRGRGISESQRRKKTWAGLTFLNQSINGLQLQIPDLSGTPPSDSMAIAQFSASTAAGLTESTILRIRGSVLIPKSSPVGTSSSLVVAFGIAIVTDEAAVQVAIPNPATVEGADWDGWMFYRAVVSAVLDADATMFDVKAMRKLQGGMSLVLVAGAASDGSVVTVGNVDVIARVLFLLP